MNVEIYLPEGACWSFRLYEKGGARREVPAHRNAEACVDAYLTVAQIAEDRKSPLVRSLDRERRLTERRVHRLEMLAMIKRRAGQRDSLRRLVVALSAPPASSRTCEMVGQYLEC